VGNANKVESLDNTNFSEMYVIVFLTEKIMDGIEKKHVLK